MQKGRSQCRTPTSSSLAPPIPPLSLLLQPHAVRPPLSPPLHHPLPPPPPPPLAPTHPSHGPPHHPPFSHRHASRDPTRPHCHPRSPHRPHPPRPHPPPPHPPPHCHSPAASAQKEGVAGLSNGTSDGMSAPLRKETPRRNKRRLLQVHPLLAPA
ncbi:unnamed protein product [Closterium sp. NIES-53]